MAAEARGNGPLNLIDAHIPSLTGTAYYVPSFISPGEEAQLLSKILSAPKPRWTTLSRRRLQTYPSRLTAANALIAEPLPSWLCEPVVGRMQGLGVWDGCPHGAPNHCLVNVYEPGQGIMPHQDGAAYWPLVATVSLGAPIVLDVFEKDGDGGRGGLVGRILQEPRSLLITTDDLYKEHLHGIAEITADENLGSSTIANWNLLGSPQDFQTGRYDRQTRTSLTYRDVLKVSNIGNSLKLFGKR
ncbi:MAG: hypothetical protein M1839_000797 [Geoglossum umbratile]|nr:MAG: hypothetical protein M1839_000797 [Geoglossum umbratile]